MHLIRAAPTIVWAAAAFAIGIAVAAPWPLPPARAYALAAAVLAAWALALAARARVAAWPAALLCFGALGYAQASLAIGSLPSWPEAADGRLVEARGVVRSPPESAGDGWRAVVHLRALQTGRLPRARNPPDASGVGPGESRPESDAPSQPVAGLVRLAGRGQPPALDVGAEIVIRGRFRQGRPAGNPGERAERDAFRRRGLLGVIRVAPGGGVVVLRTGGWSPRGTVATLRRRVVDTALQALPAPQGGLLLSLLLGIEAHLPPELYSQFARAGLVHLMVVSGAQVAIVAGACAWGARLAGLPVVPAAVASGLGVTVLAALVGWAPSVGRAVVMTGIAVVAAALGRGRDRAATLAAAALALLVLQPAVLFDVGFQLSFAATWGLLFAAPALRPHLGWLWPPVAAGAAATLGAQIAVVPLLAAHFQTVAAAGFPANLLALPVVAVLVPAGFALIPVMVVAPATGGMLLGLLRPGLDLLLWVGARFAALPWAALPTPPVSPVAAAFLYACLGGWVAAATGSLRLSRVHRLAGTAGIVCVLALWYAAATGPPRALVVTVLDVGQGDAILIQSPSGRSALVDGGGEVGGGRGGWDVGRMRVVPALRRAGVRRLDVVLLTHPHEDHVGGLPAVVENFPVELVLDPGVAHPSPSYTRLLRLVEAARIPYRIAREGMAVDLGAGARITVLYPPQPIPALEGDPVHAGSVVVRLTHGRSSALLAGDIEAPAEAYLVDRGAPLASQVLKVAHHGSRTSTTAAFVARVRPEVAVISVGAENQFGHPHPATLAALTAAGVGTYRTDRDGAVAVTSDGLRWRVTVARSRAGAGVR